MNRILADFLHSRLGDCRNAVFCILLDLVPTKLPYRLSEDLRDDTSSLSSLGACNNHLRISVSTHLFHFAPIPRHPHISHFHPSRGLVRTLWTVIIAEHSIWQRWMDWWQSSSRSHGRSKQSQMWQAKCGRMAQAAATTAQLIPQPPPPTYTHTFFLLDSLVALAVLSLSLKLRLVTIIPS